MRAKKIIILIEILQKKEKRKLLEFLTGFSVKMIKVNLFYLSPLRFEFYNSKFNKQFVMSTQQGSEETDFRRLKRDRN